MLRLPTLWTIPEDLPNADKDLRRDLNACVLRLAHMRPATVDGADQELRLSKIAWKLKSLIAALLHRVVALSDGVALAMNAKSTLIAILAARALIETLAVTALARSQIKDAVAKADIEQVGDISFAWLMATRDASLVADFPTTKALNIVTVLDKLAKTNDVLKLIRDQYDWLSEICHPNGQGGFFLFGSLDRATTVVTFAAEQNPQRHLDNLHAALTLLLISEDWIQDLMRLIPTVALMHGVEEPPCDN